MAPDPGRGRRPLGAAADAAGVDRGGGRARASRGWPASTAAACCGCTAGSTVCCAPPAARCGVPARLGVAPTRFAAVAAATRSRPRRPELVGVGTHGVRDDPRGCARTYLAPLPVALLRARPALAALPEALERLGIVTLGEFAGLSREAVADRFGAVGLVAHDLAGGGDTPLTPRVFPARCCARRSSCPMPPPACSSSGGSGCSSIACSPVASVTAGRCVRSSSPPRWSSTAGPGASRSCSARRSPIRCGCVWRSPRHLARIPAPAQRLGLAVERFGPAAADQRVLLEDPAAARAARLRESAVRQARAAAGPRGGTARAHRRSGLAHPRAPRGADPLRGLVTDFLCNYYAY